MNVEELSAALNLHAIRNHDWHIQVGVAGGMVLGGRAGPQAHPGGGLLVAALRLIRHRYRDLEGESKCMLLVPSPLTSNSAHAGVLCAQRGRPHGRACMDLRPHPAGGAAGRGAGVTATKAGTAWTGQAACLHRRRPKIRAQCRRFWYVCVAGPWVLLGN